MISKNIDLKSKTVEELRALKAKAESVRPVHLSFLVDVCYELGLRTNPSTGR